MGAGQPLESTMGPVRLPSRRQGFSLVEVLLVIGIIIALAIAIFVLYPRVRATQQSAYEAQALTSIQAGVRQTFPRGYDGLNSGVANQTRVFPTFMNGGDYSNAVVVRNSWNGEVRVTDPNPSVAGDRRFLIEYEGVPTANCALLVADVGKHFEEIFVEGVVVKAPREAVDQAALAEQCGVDDAVGILFLSE